MKESYSNDFGQDLEFTNVPVSTSIALSHETSFIDLSQERNP
jgi:hypothetical protein